MNGEIKNTTKVDNSVVFNDLIEFDTEFQRIYHGNLTEEEANDKEKTEKTLVHMLTERGYHHNQNSLNFDEIDLILNKCKIGLWASETNIYKIQIYNSVRDLCNPIETYITETHKTEAKTQIKAEIVPGVFLVSDWIYPKWISTIVKNDTVIGQRVPSTVALDYTDDKRDRGLKRALEACDVGDKTTCATLFYNTICNIPKTEFTDVIEAHNTKNIQEEIDKQDAQKPKTLEEKYPLEILKAAYAELEHGDPYQKLQDTWHNRHVGDDVIGGCCATSVACTYIQNSAGLHLKPSGDSGKGKSAGLKAFIHMLPDEKKMEGSQSSKAAYYGKLQPGTIMLVDDVDLNDIDTSALKQSTTNYQQLTNHHTVNKELDDLTLTIPERTTWWFTSTDGLNDDQVANRFMCVDVDGSVEQDKRVFARQNELEQLGVINTTIDDDVLICRAMYDIIGQDDYEIINGFCSCIEWGNQDNRRNYPMFLDMVRSMALYRVKQREKIHGVYLTTIDDFKRAAKIYSGMAETNTTNLIDQEVKLMCLIADTEKGCLRVKDVKSLANALKMSETTVRNYLNGRRGNAGLMKKVVGLSCKEVRKNEAERFEGAGKTKGRSCAIKTYSYTGDHFKGLDDYGNVATLDEKGIDAANARTLELLLKRSHHHTTITSPQKHHVCDELKHTQCNESKYISDINHHNKKADEGGKKNKTEQSHSLDINVCGVNGKSGDLVMTKPSRSVCDCAEVVMPGEDGDEQTHRKTWKEKENMIIEAINNYSESVTVENVKLFSENVISQHCDFDVFEIDKIMSFTITHLELTSSPKGGNCGLINVLQDKLQEKYKHVNFGALYNSILNYRRENRKSKDNGNLLQIDNVENFIDLFVASIHGKAWQSDHAVVRDTLNTIVEYDNNGRST